MVRPKVSPKDNLSQRPADFTKQQQANVRQANADAKIALPTTKRIEKLLNTPPAVVPKA